MLENEGVNFDERFVTTSWGVSGCWVPVKSRRWFRPQDSQETIWDPWTCADSMQQKQSFPRQSSISRHAYNILYHHGHKILCLPLSIETKIILTVIFICPPLAVSKRTTGNKTKNHIYKHRKFALLLEIVIVNKCFSTHHSRRYLTSFLIC